ncbi:MAG: Rrf2 family transcriptional regulator [Tissierellia bacterium]|nr:Rrf2 family transcriptional regulator [Tissierellia bacterium]
MKISTRGRYALRMLLDIANHQDQGVVRLAEVAERQKISKKYLEQIVVLLRGEELLVGHRGNRGGYTLARDPKDITLDTILKVTENEDHLIPCTDPDYCERSDYCLTRNMWLELEEMIHKFFAHITLEDLRTGRRKLNL